MKHIKTISAFAKLLPAILILLTVSCQKDVPELPDLGQKNLTYFTADFEQETVKTYLANDGLTPRWETGDQILLVGSNNNIVETITIIDASGNYSGGKESLEAGQAYTDRNGKLVIATSMPSDFSVKAIYPASAADEFNYYENLLSWDSNPKGTKIRIPATQDGTFKNAHICLGYYDCRNSDVNFDEGANHLVFKNITSIVKFTLTENKDILAMKLISENTIAGIWKGDTETTTEDILESNGSQNCINIFPNGPQSVYYIALPPGIETGNLTLRLLKKDSFADIEKSSKKITRNKMYDFGNLESVGISFRSGRGFLAGHEYVLVTDSEGNSLKWATENIAITESGKRSWMGLEYVVGDYFLWSEPSVLFYDTFNNVHCGNFSSYFSNGNGLAEYDLWDTEYFDNVGLPLKYNQKDKLLLLDSEDDMASVIWGEPWRMPNNCEGEPEKGIKPYETQALINALYWVYDASDAGFYAFEPDASHSKGTVGKELDGFRKKDALLFFPMSGKQVPDARNEGDGTEACFWTASRDSREEIHYIGNAYAFYAQYDPETETASVFVSTAYRENHNLPVRPVAD